MAKFIVARGEIHRGTEVVARQGESYAPKNAEEEKRLLARGIIAPEPGAQKGSSKGGGQKGEGGQADE